MSTKLQRKQPRSFVGPKPPSQLWMERDDIQWQISTFAAEQSFIGSGPLVTPSLAMGQQRRFDSPQPAMRPKSLGWTEFAGNFSTSSPSSEHVVAPLADPAIRATSVVRTDRIQSLETLAGIASQVRLSDTNQAQGTNDSSGLEQQYRRLLAEAAHDIRSPVASASQIIDAISRRAVEGNKIAASDLGLLRVANQRLAQANNWTARILADRRLEGLSGTQLKRRFYPAQWKSLMQPLLQFIAEEHGVRLLWIDWERSLPKLYLDAGLLSRSMLNLVTNAVQACKPGDQVTIRAGWRSDSTSRFVIHVEDQGPGMPLEVLQSLNGSRDLLSSDSTLPNQSSKLGLGLEITKSMVGRLGGNLSGQNSTSRGASLRLSLPTDDLASHLRSWLLRLDADAPRTGLERTFSLFGIRAVGEEPLAVDQHIASFAGDEDLLYRFSRNGWLYYSARPYASVEQTIEQICEVSCHPAAAIQLKSLRLATTGARALGSRELDMESGRKKESGRKNLGIPAFAEQLFNYAQPLLQKAIPAVDDLHAELEAGFQSTLEHLSPKFAAPTRIDSAHAANSIRRPHAPTKIRPMAEPNLKDVNSSNPQDDFARSLKRIANNWRATQASMQESHRMLSRTRNAS